jgi:hypothetical protein
MPRLALLFAVFLATSSAWPGEVARHSGLIVAVDAARGTLTLDETGPWHSGTRDVRRGVTLTPGTRLVLASRVTGRAQNGWSGGFDERPLAPEDLHVGDYATVTLTKRDGHLVALSITVVRPEGAMASPLQPAPAPGAATEKPHHVG